LSKWFQTRRFLWEFPIGSYVLCKLEKRGDEIKKKSSPVKLLSQSQPNFAEMILGWSSSKTVSGISELRPIWQSSKFIKNPVMMFKTSSLCFNSSNLGTFWLKIEQFWPFKEINWWFDT
jgi:hypothetical protein